MEAVFGIDQVQSMHRIVTKEQINQTDFSTIKKVFESATQQHDIVITPWACARPLSSNISPTVGQTHMKNAWTIAEAGSYGISFSIALAFKGLQDALGIKELAGVKERLCFDATKSARLEQLISPTRSSAV